MTREQKIHVDDIIKSCYNEQTGRMMALVFMAENDIFPDWTWSDDECSIWSTIRMALHRAKAD